MRPSVMPPSPYAYASPFHAPQPQYFAFPELTLPSHQDFSMHNDHLPPSHQHPAMQPPPSPSIPIDPALALYPPYYSTYQHHPPPHIPQHLSIQPNYSSPSSQGSDTIGTPPTEHMYPPSSSSAMAANMNGKRPSSSVSNSHPGESRKKAKRDDESDVHSPSADKDEVKAKPTRGSRACTVCRRLKMKCVGAEQGPPCKRCQSGNHECIFEESNRGKRSSKKHEILTRSLRKMERTLDTVLRSIGNPSIASGMISRSPSPPAQAAGTQALLSGTSPSPPASTSATAAAYQPSHQHQHSQHNQQGQQQQGQGQGQGQGQKHHPPGSPKLHSLPDNALNPLGLLAEASLANRRAQATNPSGMVARAANGDVKVGVASDNYFKPGPMTILPLRRLYIERQVQPEMLSFVSTEEVVELFNIYFDHIHMHCNLLDRNFHTPALVCSRSPFLLTTICSIASKFYTPKPDLHPRLTELAKRLAFSVPAKGYKSVEIVQAYLLLALWGCGAVERYEQDKTWLLLGMAIRMATDLNLHRKTAVTSADTAEGRARDVEIHNRERTWILCFILDRSFSAQMGKPSSIREDYIIRHTHEWYTSPVASPSDASLAAYCELQRILSRSLEFLYSGTDSPSGLQVQCDYMLVIKTFETQVLAWAQEWIEHRSWAVETSTPLDYKRMISQFYLNYAMLVLNSFGLQNALDRNPVDIGHFFARVHSSAHACATIVRDQLGPSGYLRYSPDSHFVQTSYAVLSLLKLVRPEFQAFLDNEQETLTLVRDVADVLDNNAANPLHTPALYSTFLRALISAKLDQTSGSSEDKSTSGGDGNGNDLNDNNNSLSLDGQPEFSQNNSNSNGNSNTSGLTLNNPHHHQQAQSSSSSSSNPFGAPDPSYLLNEFQFDSEMGPVADMSTFPPTMAPNPSEDSMGMMLTMENILSSGFWDSMLVPGYNSMDALSGGFVFGAGGSGLITPRFGGSPAQSGSNTPGRANLSALTQTSINAAFDNSRTEVGVKMDA